MVVSKKALRITSVEPTSSDLRDEHEMMLPSCWERPFAADASVRRRSTARPSRGQQWAGMPVQLRTSIKGSSSIE